MRFQSSSVAAATATAAATITALNEVLVRPILVSAGVGAPSRVHG